MWTKDSDESRLVVKKELQKNKTTKEQNYEMCVFCVCLEASFRVFDCWLDKWLVYRQSFPFECVL